jgi:hypothetical protein
MLYPLSYGGEFHATDLENALGQWGHVSFRRFRRLRRPPSHARAGIVADSCHRC